MTIANPFSFFYYAYFYYTHNSFSIHSFHSKKKVRIEYLPISHPPLFSSVSIYTLLLLNYYFESNFWCVYKFLLLYMCGVFTHDNSTVIHNNIHFILFIVLFALSENSFNKNVQFNLSYDSDRMLYFVTHKHIYVQQLIQNK